MTTGPDLYRVRSLSEQGLSARQIGELIGVSSRTVVRYRTNPEDTMLTTTKQASAWRNEAACLNHTAVFFPKIETATALATARRVCGICPVRTECLDDAIAHETGGSECRSGIRGGKDPVQRATLATSRRKNASKKKAADAARAAA